MSKKNILVLGAGRSSYYLIDYLQRKAADHDWSIHVADLDTRLMEAMHPAHGRLSYQALNVVSDPEALKAMISNADLVISMLPASMHHLVARPCLDQKRNLLTASYVSDGMLAMKDEIEKAGLTFMMELGVDPGIDHMSACQLFESLRARGAKIEAFRSYTGGLVAPESDDNPWNYKISWNPANIMSAGKSGGTYLRDNGLKRIPYHRLFEEIDLLEIPGHGSFDAYYNRDSIKYVQQYGLAEVPTVVRYTLRRQGFCRAWAALVNLGMTEDSYALSFDTPIAHRDYTAMFVRKGEGNLEERTAKAIGERLDSEVMQKLRWLGLFDDEPISITKGTSANFLLDIVAPKWKMEETDMDMIYMMHEVDYSIAGKRARHKSYMAVKGEDSRRTAMAKTVGLPLAIAACKVLTGEFRQIGLEIPVKPEIYEPILKELGELGIGFSSLDEPLTAN